MSPPKPHPRGWEEVAQRSEGGSGGLSCPPHLPVTIGQGLEEPDPAEQKSHSQKRAEKGPEMLVSFSPWLGPLTTSPPSSLVHLSCVSVPLSLPVCLSLCISPFLLVSLCLCVSLSLCVFLCLCLSPSVSLGLSVPLSLTLPH